MSDKTSIEPLQGKNIAIVAMGQSQIDFHLSQINSVIFDEVWAINAMIGALPNIDRAFILDPMSRFLDTEDAGGMTDMMRMQLPLANYPIYSCELDARIPAVLNIHCSLLWKKLAVLILITQLLILLRLLYGKK